MASAVLRLLSLLREVFVFGPFMVMQLLKDPF